MKEKKLIKSLEYRIKRYQSVGNGPMCQNLRYELEKLATHCRKTFSYDRKNCLIG